MTTYAETLAALRREPRTWLVTGVGGFIGSNLLEALLKLDQNVVGLDNFSSGYRRNLDEVRGLVSEQQWAKFVCVEGDLRDAARCGKACDGVDYVLHHAAIGSVPRSVENPLEADAVNAAGTLNLLVAARDRGVKRFVFASGAKNKRSRAIA